MLCTEKVIVVGVITSLMTDLNWSHRVVGRKEVIVSRQKKSTKYKHSSSTFVTKPLSFYFFL